MTKHFPLQAADTVNDRDTEKAFAALSKPSFAAKCAASDTLSRQVGKGDTAAGHEDLIVEPLGSYKKNSPPSIFFDRSATATRRRST